MHKYINPPSQSNGDRDHTAIIEAYKTEENFNIGKKRITTIKKKVNRVRGFFNEIKKKMGNF
jgi:hypothetical protein